MPRTSGESLILFPLTVYPGEFGVWKPFKKQMVLKIRCILSYGFVPSNNLHDSFQVQVTKCVARLYSGYDFSRC